MTPDGQNVTAEPHCVCSRSSPRWYADAVRAIGYIRVSAVGGRSGPEYHTLDVQRASIERVCASRGYDLVDVYVEENRSGADRTRPQFREAMQRILDGEADAMAVWKVSRFSRSWAQAAEDTEALLAGCCSVYTGTVLLMERSLPPRRVERSSAGKDLLSGEEGFDTTTSGGRLLLRAAGLPALALDWAELDEEARLVALRGGLERVVIGPGRRGGDPVDRLTVRWLDDD